MERRDLRIQKWLLVSTIFFFILFGVYLPGYCEWTSVGAPSVSSNWSVNSVHFTSPNEGWAVGNDNNTRGVLLHYVNGLWTSVTPPDMPKVPDMSDNWWLESVHFTSPSEGWAVGPDYRNGTGVLLHYSGGTWAVVTPPDSSTTWGLNGVYFPSPDEGWAVGSDYANFKGVLLHYSEGSWTFVTPAVESLTWSLQGVYFTSPSEGWAVGSDTTHQRGLLLHYSGGTWTSVDPPNVSSNWWLWAGVHFTSSNEGWAVGWDPSYLTNTSKGVLLHYSDGTWTSVAPPVVRDNWQLRGVYFASPSEGWAVGGYPNTNDSQGVLLHYSGGTWTSVAPPDVSSNWLLRGVHFTSTNEGWAVGSDNVEKRGVLLHYQSVPPCNREVYLSLRISGKYFQDGNHSGRFSNSDLGMNLCTSPIDGVSSTTEAFDGFIESNDGEILRLGGTIIWNSKFTSGTVLGSFEDYSYGKYVYTNAYIDGVIKFSRGSYSLSGKGGCAGHDAEGFFIDQFTIRGTEIPTDNEAAGTTSSTRRKAPVKTRISR